MKGTEPLHTTAYIYVVVHAIRTPFQGDFLVRVVPRAEALGCFLFAVGRLELAQENVQTPEARSAWVAMQRDRVPEGRSKSWSVPQIFVVETEPRLQKRQVFLWKSSGPMMFDLILDVMNGFWQLRDAHTQNAVTLLPAEVVQL